MNTILENFVRVVKDFSRKNWWVYIIYFSLLSVIFVFEHERLTEVVLITTLHFVADIFIMMMFSAYADQKNRRGTYYQVISMLIFLSLKLYTGFVHDTWHYLAADPIYILAALKNYQVDVKKGDIKLINYRSMIVLSLLIFAGLLLIKQNNNAVILTTASEWVQTIGIFLFAIALSVTGKESLRSRIAIGALICMVGGSAWETVLLLVKGKIIGLALSYFLLPLTVLVFYLKRKDPPSGHEPAPRKKATLILYQQEPGDVIQPV